MNKLYDADIGTWESGKTITISAPNPSAALGIAAKHCGPKDDVVQIRDSLTGRYVYDYFNGFKIYIEEQDCIEGSNPSPGICHIIQ